MTFPRIAVPALAIAAIGMNAIGMGPIGMGALAQTAMPPHGPAASGAMHGPAASGAMHGPGPMGAMHHAHPPATGAVPTGGAPVGGVPASAGQAAFGAIQDIVEMLRADPATDWSKVDIDALRRHLIDMDEVTLRAAARKTPVENGLRIEVTGTGRTQEAIQRMLPDHAKEISGKDGWTVTARPIDGGIELTATARDPADIQKIRALGFMGIMALGRHHQLHHVAMSKGMAAHAH